MKSRIVFVCLLCLSTYTHGQPVDVAIIPQPVSIARHPGNFELTDAFTIAVKAPANKPDVNHVVNVLNQRLTTATGFHVAPRDTKNERATITLVLLPVENKLLGKEGYRLNVHPDSISILANQPAGLFYGVQTLLQVFPKEIESSEPNKQVRWIIPCVTIEDYPRFAWRGMLLDVSRHFFSKEQVKEFIDEMVRYKYNLLHWHLTDDQGWRVEIKSLPNLTRVGAWRTERVGKWGTFSKPSADEPRAYGGYYTQEDVREIIQYAKDRFVTIMPEIDVPGHSLAIIASYPELSCTPGSYQVNSGEKFMEWYEHDFKAIVDNTLCPANEKVYEYLDKIFTEVAQLFPYEYIHLGGDECAKNFWEQSEAVATLMRKQKLNNMDEVQNYFVQRIAKIIQSKGKKVVGWDEILAGGKLPPHTAIMSWRGVKGGIEAARQGYPVIMTPNSNCYLDLYQGDPVAEPQTYSMLRLRDSYQFDPVPEGIDPKLILGGQANLWTEQISTVRHAQYMMWPRSFAVSEALWSQPNQRDWNNFVQRVETHFGRYDVAEIKYSKSLYDPIFVPRRDGDGRLLIELETEIDGLDIYYSFDESNPDRYYPKYTQVLSVPKDAVTLKVITYRKTEPAGKQINMPIAELERRLK